MVKNRPKTGAIIETRAENNRFDFNETVFKNNGFDSIIQAKLLLGNLGILHNKLPQLIVTQMIYKWHNSDIEKSFIVLLFWNII